MKSPYHILAYTLLPLLRSRIWTVRGLQHIPTSGGFILVANHQSWIDSAMLAAAVYRRLHKPLKFISQSNKYGSVGALKINKHDRSKVLDQAQAFLEQGFPVVVFPEGNSNADAALRAGKTGAARLALRTGLPVIPVGIKGTRGVAAWRAALWFLSIVRPCHVEIGTPMSFPKTEIHDNQTELLHTTTDTILERISVLSGKSMPGEGISLGRRGKFWFFLWRIARPLSQWRIRIRGAQYLPVSGAFMLAGNHNSYFDAPALAMAVFHVTGMQTMFPTKASVAQKFEQRAGRGALHVLGMLPLNDADKSSVLQPAIEHLRQGGVIGIFPEGMRNKPKVNPKWETEMLKGKTGAARLAITSKVPIIPVAIRAPKGFGLGATMRNAFLPWKFVRVTFSPPVVLTDIPANIEQATKEDLERLTRQIMQPIGQLCGRTYPY